MDPVSQVLAQQQSGSAGGQGFGQFFVAGQQHGLARERLKLEQKQEERLQKRDDMLLPLQASLIGAQVANLGVEAVINTQKAQITTAINAALPEINELNMQFMAAPDGFANEELRKKTAVLAKKYFLAFGPDTPGGNLLMGIKAAAMFEQQMQQMDQVFKRLQPGESMSLPGGMRFDKDATKASNLPANLQEAAAITSLRQKVAAEQDPARKQALQTELDDMLMTVLPAGTITEVFDPATGNPIMRTSTGRQSAGAGTAPGALTQQQQGTLKLQRDKLVDTATRVGELAENADKLFGPMAGGKTVVVDRVLANLIPSLAEGQRIEGRNKAALVREGIIRALGEGQGQLSNRDVERFTQALPELGSIAELAEAPARARAILKGLQKEMARDAYERERTMGLPPSPEALRLMDPYVLLKEFREKRITQDQFIKAIDASPHKADAEALLNQF